MIGAILSIIRQNNETKKWNKAINNLKGDIPRDINGKLKPVRSIIEKRETIKDKYGNDVEIRTTYLKY